MIGHDLLVYAGTVAIFLIGFIATVLLFLAVFGVVVLAVGIVRAFQGRRVGVHVQAEKQDAGLLRHESLTGRLRKCAGTWLPKLALAASPRPKGRFPARRSRK